MYVNLIRIQNVFLMSYCQLRHCRFISPGTFLKISHYRVCPTDVQDVMLPTIAGQFSYAYFMCAFREP